MANIDYIDLIEDISKNGGDIWESCVTTGLEAQKMLDEGRWTIGDLARLIATKKYGKNAIGDFAKAINYDVGRVRDYRRVARFWQKAVRTAILEDCKNLNYTFLRPCFGPAIYRMQPREDIKARLETKKEFNITIDMDITQQAARRGEKDKRVGKCEATFHITPKAHHKQKNARRRDR